MFWSLATWWEAFQAVEACGRGSWTRNPYPRIRVPIPQDQCTREPVAQDQCTREPVAQDQCAREPVAQDQCAREPVAQDQCTREPVAQDQCTRKPVIGDQCTQSPVLEPTFSRASGSVRNWTRDPGSVHATARERCLLPPVRASTAPAGRACSCIASCCSCPNRTAQGRALSSRALCRDTLRCVLASQRVNCGL